MKDLFIYWLRTQRIKALNRRISELRYLYQVESANGNFTLFLEKEIEKTIKEASWGVE